MRKGLAKLKSSAKKKKKSVLDKVIDFFIKTDYRAYLVGGYVRDLKLGRESVDIDIVVEGDGTKIGKLLNARLKGKLDIHKEFKTASITINNQRIDLASARVERYPAPGQLPHVYPSTIIEDLNRRDFTINAIAMAISKDNFGEIFDPFNGLEDIKKGLIRVLHRNSFVDDPTRVFRALRYKNRFGFRIEEDTEVLMRDAIANQMINNLSGQRLLNELQLIFIEETYQKTIEDISNYKIFKIRQNDLKMLPLLGEEKIYFYLSRLSVDDISLRKDERKKINDFFHIFDTVVKLSKASKNSAIFNILSPISEEVVKILPSVRPALKNKIKIYLSLKKAKPIINGNDLKRLGFKPGRKFKMILKKVFNMQLNMELKNRKEANQFLKTIKKK